ncbi:MAG: GTP-binding protein [Rubripirellula sp.]|nr:GTP-binding protein [Rubripirellula sp.]
MRTLPVTVLSGSPGTGKTPRLNQVLHNQVLTNHQEIRVAVIANDTSDLSRDAALVENGHANLPRTEEQLVEMSNEHHFEQFSIANCKLNGDTKIAHAPESQTTLLKIIGTSLFSSQQMKSDLAPQVIPRGKAETEIEEHGDRRQERVFIGNAMDEDHIRGILDSFAMTGAELEGVPEA